MNVTMRDVAIRANVSIKTVSRVVNNEGEISEDTRTRVLQTIHELGYRPNLVARSLVTQRTSVIGLVIPDICNPYFAEVSRGVQERAQAAGYSLIIASSDESHDAELRIARSMYSQGVDAVIAATTLTPEWLNAFGNGTRPIVLINNRYDHPAVGTVNSDNYAGARAAVEHLIARGHRTIAMLAGLVADPRTVRRVRAYRDALVSHRLPFDEQLVIPCLPRMVEGGAATYRLLAERPDVTALFCYNDLLALGALRACAEMGRRVPQHVAVVGFDDIDFASIATPSLTTVRVDKRELGRQAASLVLSMLADMQSASKSVDMPAELVTRESA